MVAVEEEEAEQEEDPLDEAGKGRTQKPKIALSSAVTISPRGCLPRITAVYTVRRAHKHYTRFFSEKEIFRSVGDVRVEIFVKVTFTKQ